MYILGDNIIFPSITTLTREWIRHIFSWVRDGRHEAKLSEIVGSEKLLHSNWSRIFFNKNVRNPETSFFFCDFFSMKFIFNETTGPFFAKTIQECWGWCRRVAIGMVEIRSAPGLLGILLLMKSWEFKVPPQCQLPQEISPQFWPYQGKPMVNSPLIRLALGGGGGGVPKIPMMKESGVCL